MSLKNTKSNKKKRGISSDSLEEAGEGSGGGSRMIVSTNT